MKVRILTRFVFVAWATGFVAAGCNDDMGDGSLSTLDTDSLTATDVSSDTDSTTSSETQSDTETQDSSSETGTSSDSQTGEGQLGGFGDPCETNEDCESGVCHEFGQLGFTCTLECSDAMQCPDGSEGQKCNQQGVCRP